MVYGPTRDTPTLDYTDNRTPVYLNGVSAKIKHDILKKFRMYEGKHAYLFKINKNSDRCITCTDSITGAIVLSDCDICGGTGYVTNYQYYGKFWIKIDITPLQDIATDFGNTENSGSRRDFITLVEAPIVKDSDLIVLVDTMDIYKVLDIEGQLSAIAGIILTQTVSCTFLTRGSNEHTIIQELIEDLSGSGSGSGST